MTPKALFALCDELLHEVLRPPRPPMRWCRPFPPEPCAGRPRAQTLAETVLRGAAPSREVPVPGALRPRLDRAPADPAGLAGSEAHLNAAITEGEHLAGQLPPVRSDEGLEGPQRRAGAQPARVAGRAAEGAGRRGVRRAGRGAAATRRLDLRVNAIKVKREAAYGEALAAEGISAQPTPFSPLGLRVDGNRRSTAPRSSTAARSRCRTRATSCWRC